MPPIIVELQKGRNDEQKPRLCREITHAVMSALGSDETSISVAIENVNAEDWTDKVFKPDILVLLCH